MTYGFATGAPRTAISAKVTRCKGPEQVAAAILRVPAISSFLTPV